MNKIFALSLIAGFVGMSLLGAASVSAWGGGYWGGGGYYPYHGYGYGYGYPGFYYRRTFIGGWPGYGGYWNNWW